MACLPTPKAPGIADWRVLPLSLPKSKAVNSPLEKKDSLEEPLLASLGGSQVPWEPMDKNAVS